MQVEVQVQTICAITVRTLHLEGIDLTGPQMVAEGLKASDLLWRLGNWLAPSVALLVGPACTRADHEDFVIGTEKYPILVIAVRVHVDREETQDHTVIEVE